MARLLPDRPRVFCIGWHKTGTTTLGLALIELGYSVLGCRLDMVHPLQRGDLDAVLTVAGDFDALQDVPWAVLFRELDQRYPGSRFIYTDREDSAWLKSASNHFGDKDIPLHHWIYGEARLQGHEELYLERFRRHRAEVLAYFHGRSKDFLYLDLASGDGWAEICPFLGVETLRRPFLHANKAIHSFNRRDWLVHRMRSALPIGLRRAIFSVRLGFRRLRGEPDPRNRFHNMVENRREREMWKRVRK